MGMSRFWFVMLFLLSMTEASCVHAETAEAFIANVVRMDFDGDADGRLDRVVDVQPESDLAPGVYELDYDPLVIVQRWELVGIEKSGPEVCIKFRFEVAARSEGTGAPSWEREAARQFIRVSPAKDEEVLYCAIQRDGQWKLQGAPVPRVGRLTMLAYLGDGLAGAEYRLLQPISTDPRALLNRTRIRDWYKRQLDMLASE